MATSASGRFPTESASNVIVSGIASAMRPILRRSARRTANGAPPILRSSERNRQWYAANAEKKHEYERQRRGNDPTFKFMHNMRRRMQQVLKGKSKSASTIALFGCDPAWFLTEWAPIILREYSAKYGVEMTLENHGKVWHWDHCEALAGFDQSDPTWQRIAWRWDNLRPLPAAANLGKGTKSPDPDEMWMGIPSNVPAPPA